MRLTFQICIALAGLAVSAAILSGCALWTEGLEKEQPQLKWKDVFGTDGPEVVDARRAPVETIVLEITHLEQPLSDLSLVDLLWKDVAEVGTLGMELRRNLEANGFRVGIIGSNPPRVLDSLMEVDVGWRAQQEGHQVVPNNGRVAVFPGDPFTVLASDTYETCRIEIPRESVWEPVDYENVSCRFCVKAQKVQNGWVKLEFVPEIHHGANAVRWVASDDGRQMSNSQRIERLYGQRFELTLNKGEMAVLTATNPDSSRLGHAFFVGNGDDDHRQRLMIVRLVDIVPARRKLSRER